MAALAVENLTFRYAGADSPALTDINLNIATGDFVVLAGPTGCGKTTLLHHLKPELVPAGERSGAIYFRGEPMTPNPRNDAGLIGLVAQDPGAQLTMDTVRRELVFGMENMQVSPDEMHRRLGELAGFFGMTSWLDRPLKELSGGQQQMVNLAAVMLLRPEVLLLDEPTSQLDPVTAKEFLHLLARINDEFGTTVIISEHRLEEVFPLTGTAVFLAEGAVEYTGPVDPLCRRLWEGGGESRSWTPSLAKVALAVGSDPAYGETSPVPLPLTVRDGRSWLEKHKSRLNLAARGKPHDKYGHRPTTGEDDAPVPPDGGTASSTPVPPVEIRGLTFQYTPSGPKVLHGAELMVPENEVFTILGANGAGKSTLLKLMLGLLVPQSGAVRIGGRPAWRIRNDERFRLLGYLDQNPALYFAADTVGEALRDRVRQLGLEEDEHAVDEVTERLGLDRRCLHRHPYDLSGGELQLAALCLIMLADPLVLLLDEPTKGLDPAAKDRLGGMLRRLARHKSIIMASHDVEFAAAYADSCALLFDGRLLNPGPTPMFFRENYFYTTSVSRVFRGVLPGAVTWRDVIPCP